MERRPSLTNIIEFRRQSAISRRTIKKANRETWRKFCSSLSGDTPSKKVWNMLRRMNGKAGQPTISSLSENGQIVSDPKEIADMFADCLDQTFGQISPTINEEEKRVLTRALQEQEEESGSKSRFTSQELKECINSL